jgi:hypothetical protein
MIGVIAHERKTLPQMTLIKRISTDQVVSGSGWKPPDFSLTSVRGVAFRQRLDALLRLSRQP